MPEHSDPYRKDSSIASPSNGGARPPPKAGDIIGEKYRIETVIGQGGMGAVFRARHLLTERAVAVKWMLPEVGGEEAVQRFLREARAMGRIDHPGVVGVLDVGVDDGATFLVMELLKGNSLRDMLEAHERFEPAEAIGLLMPALEGVEAAHRNHVVHRDLKPENIFIVRSGDGTIETTKVLDFGISKLRDDRLDHSPQVDIKKGGVVTRTGVTIGTPSYMSPEQVRGSRDIDMRTDVWSLGVILYELLTGEVPFRAESFGSLLVAIATESYPPLDAVRPELPAMLVAAVHRALEKDPSIRFADVASFAAALERFGPPGCRFRAPDVSRPTDVTPEPRSEPRAAAKKPELAGTVAAKPRADASSPDVTAPARPPERARLGGPAAGGPRAPLDPTAPPPSKAGLAPTRASDPDIASRGLDLPSPAPLPREIGTAHTALAVSARAPEPEPDEPARIPSLPPLALEDVPRRPVRSSTSPAQQAPPASTARARPAPEPREPAPDATRYLKLGGALLVGAVVVAVLIRLAAGAMGSTPVTAATPAATTPRVEPRVTPPARPARAGSTPDRPMPAWPPPGPSTPPSTAGRDLRTLSPPPPSAPIEPSEASSAGSGHRPPRREPRAQTAPATQAGSAPQRATATATMEPSPPATSEPSGRTGSLSREEF